MPTGGCTRVRSPALWSLQTLCVTVNYCRYVNFCMQRIHMLKFYNVTPLIVFDGGYLPAKAHLPPFALFSISRLGRRRDENKAKGIALLREGKKQQAVECFQKCVDVTPEMAYQFIKALRSESVQYVVAPYEADAQLAYLSRTGKVDAVITEDSDLIVFGCERIIYKLDQYGACVEIRRDRFAAVTEVNFVGWTDELLRQMCILSGCDYLPSIPGMGLKTAHRMLRQLRTAEKVIRSVRMDGQLRVPPDYEKAFRRAELTFWYQRVYDLDARALTTVNPVPQGLDISEMDFLGPLLEPEVARGIATGDLNPITKEPIVDLTADASKDQENIALHARRKPVSPWLQRNKTFRPKPSTTPNAKSITNYFKPVTPVPLSQLIESNLPEDVAGESQATVQAEMDQLDMSLSQDSLFVPSTPTQKCTPPEILSPASAASSLKRRASDSYAFHRGHDDPNRPPRPVNVFSKPSPSPSHSASIATNKKMTISRFFGGAK
ncbi:PIN domain-like protein, partial [Jimgerdemannia flammicorona]